ncbi:MAG: phosphoribosylformylglycinamidine synthase II [Spirochaetaceae bacterium]|nr:phosphoribosylformylglycinamidine synthase II [Spirochaetaceae bacterium]|tara:strand:+ start:49280 stop:51556 length:2277 start_codon:yes stop_codon:yes gene_type:complete
MLYSEKEITLDDALEHGLTEEEFQKIQQYLGRVPTVTELGIYSGMWSEHCSYKNSILLLKTLPSESPDSLARAGEENAGALDIGEGLAVVFKIESHNHPSAIEPYQGAATGVGGIMRDIFTMGARPICSLNSLRFGPPDESRNQYLLKRAVAGIGDYGNSLGIAVSGGELFFDPSFSRNCLVNAMTVGIVTHEGIARARADGPGNPVFYVGATTGRDGIHGASFASRDLSQESEEKRSAVQVGDPFMEKLLLEASLELIATGAIIGIQDMGAAGLSCSTSEMSAKSETGMDIDLDKVPLREDGMNAYEIMLSESQERMLVVGKPGREQEIIDIFNKWDLHAVQIGSVNEDGKLRVRREGKLCAEIPADSLVLGGGAPQYKRETRKPAYIDELAAKPDESIPALTDASGLQKTFLDLVKRPNLASKRPVFEQYDTEVGLVRVHGPGGDGGVVRIPGTTRALSVSTDCNSRFVYLEPRQGARIAVCESARNVAVTGARPLGITNCLNFGNPYIPENYYMFSEAIGGMSDACRAFNIPVTGGNVSFYNESQDGPVLPTPTIGMVGLVPDLNRVVSPVFSKSGSLVALLGSFRPSAGGSEYQNMALGAIQGTPPELDLDLEKRLCEALFQGAGESAFLAARDLSLGGLSVGLFRSVYDPYNSKSVGFRANGESMAQLKASAGESYRSRPDLFWFSETCGAVLLNVDTAKREAVESLAKKYDLGLSWIGELTDDQTMDLNDFQIPLDAAAAAFEGGLVPYFEE